jgi:exonuclease SbcD
VITGAEGDAHLGRKVAEIVPDAVLISAEPAQETSLGSALDADLDEEPDLPDAFRAYLTERRVSSGVAQDAVSAFTHLLGELDEEEPPPVPAEELLRAALADPWTEAS